MNIKNILLYIFSIHTHIPRYSFYYTYLHNILFNKADICSVLLNKMAYKTETNRSFYKTMLLKFCDRSKYIQFSVIPKISFSLHSHTGLFPLALPNENFTLSHKIHWLLLGLSRLDLCFLVIANAIGKLYNVTQ